MQDKQTAYGIYLTFIDDYLLSLDEDSARIFRAAGLEYPNYIQPGERVSIEKLASVVQGVKRGIEQPDFFLRLGANIPMIAHGPLGAAVLGCKDVRTILTLVERYSAIAIPAVRISLKCENGIAMVEQQVQTPYPELNIALIEAVIGTTFENLSRLTLQPFFPKRVTLTYPKPEYAQLYEKFTQCVVEFSAAKCTFYYPERWLDLTLNTANELGQRYLVQQCEDELKRIQSTVMLSERIREIISLYLETSPTIGFVAEKLRLSERTLRRRLRDEGVNYRDLIKEIRHKAAIYYLSKTDMRIEHIAWQLGYKETANFRKAFKETTGSSPRYWREQNRGGEEQKLS